jgi:hypothetical protein
MEWADADPAEGLVDGHRRHGSSLAAARSVAPS